MTAPRPNPDRPAGEEAPPPAPSAPAAAKAGGSPGAITLAVVIGAHGIAGDVRLKVFAEDLKAHTAFNSGALTLKSLRETPQGAIARFVEVPDRNAAEALRGTELTVSRKALPPLTEGEYYHADLIGLPAVSSDGEALGTVVEVDNFGAGDVIEIERPSGKRFMVPMNAQAVPDWNAERLVVAAAFVE